MRNEKNWKFNVRPKLIGCGSFYLVANSIYITSTFSHVFTIVASNSSNSNESYLILFSLSFLMRYITHTLRSYCTVTINSISSIVRWLHYGVGGSRPLFWNVHRGKQ